MILKAIIYFIKSHVQNHIKTSEDSIYMHGNVLYLAKSCKNVKEFNEIAYNKNYLQKADTSKYIQLLFFSILHKNYCERPLL